MIQDDAFNVEIANSYHQEQPYKDVPHPPILLIFSAMPGSGKTTLAKKLAHDLQAQYVNHDDIRRIIRKRGIDPEKLFMPPISRLTINDMVAHDKNKFIIMDFSLDRTWNIYYDHVKELDALPLVVRLDIPVAIVRERLRIRDGDNSYPLNQLDRFKTEFDNCRQNVAADVTIGKDYVYAEVLRVMNDTLSR